MLTMGELASSRPVSTHRVGSASRELSPHQHDTHWYWPSGANFFLLLSLEQHKTQDIGVQSTVLPYWERGD